MDIGDRLNKITMDEITYSSNEELHKQLDYIEKIKEVLLDKEKEAGRKLAASVITFGCQMNARDSEKLIGILHKAGFEIKDDDEQADFVLYNTCTVRDNANQKVYGRLGLLGSLKKKNPSKMIALCGCMTQEAAVVDKLKESYRFINLIFGTHNIFKFPELVYLMLINDDPKHMIIDVWKDTNLIVEDLPIDRKYPFKSGVNIMFGCNNFCTYCIVPYVRGRERSRKPEDIIAEIEKLVADGVVEVMLLGQNVNSYGKNLDEDITFAELLRRVEKIEGLKRIRFMTSHPKDLSDELIEVMKESKKINPYMHLPVQAGSSRILKAMNRNYTRERYLEVVNKLKEAIPDITLTTDIIVGFPGETKEDAMETASLVKEVGYDNAFTFIYSKRTGTPAASMVQCDEKEVKENFNMILETVQETAKERIKRFEGRDMEVLVEDVNDHEEGYVTGRLANNLLVHFKGDASLIGTFCKVHLDKSKGFYFLGTRIDGN